MIKVAVVEDDTTIRETLCQYLSSQSDFYCDMAYESVESMLHNLNSSNLPEVILMDIGLPGMSGISGIKIIKQKFPEINIVMLTVYNDANKVFQSLCAGASGYLLKNAPFSEIKEAIYLVTHDGASMSPQIARKVVEYFHPEKKKHIDSPLTAKEKEIVLGLVDGLSYKMIADRKNVSIETVRSHIKNIYKKLHVHNKAEVITKSLQGEI
jgi:DNA-binding NarL/FixJ family response regulator